jgi:hypothetical protein
MLLMLERKEPGLLDAPPRDSKVQIINGLFLTRVVLLGLAIRFIPSVVPEATCSPAMRSSCSKEA